mmetsp:Transcript_7000/g.24837  ORF Transcript_7000/g.24837 Transcript_7000/m.24837 type:complete len:206 (+) Transcript_7000:397-1014(+)
MLCRPATMQLSTSVQIQGVFRKLPWHRGRFRTTRLDRHVYPVQTTTMYTLAWLRTWQPGRVQTSQQFTRPKLCWRRPRPRTESATGGTSSTIVGRRRKFVRGENRTIRNVVASAQGIRSSSICRSGRRNVVVATKAKERRPRVRPRPVVHRHARDAENKSHLSGTWLEPSFAHARTGIASFPHTTAFPSHVARSGWMSGCPPQAL